MGSGDRAGGGSRSASGSGGRQAAGLPRALVAALLPTLVHRLPSGGESGEGGERAPNSGGLGGADSRSSSRQLASLVGREGTGSDTPPRNRS